MTILGTQFERKLRRNQLPLLMTDARTLKQVEKSSESFVESTTLSAATAAVPH